jgi:hypothetical protein
MDAIDFRSAASGDEMELFAFESDFVATLRCIPMAVRLKLDRAGIKLSLRQWSRFTLADRSELLRLACAATAEIALYRTRLIELIALRANEAAKNIPLPDAEPWMESELLPAAVEDHARKVGLRSPTVEQWRALSTLRRFTLLKLTRDNHDNVNFGPAMREFGLL